MRGLGARAGCKAWVRGLGARAGCKGWVQGLGARAGCEGWVQGSAGSTLPKDFLQMICSVEFEPHHLHCEHVQ